MSSVPWPPSFETLLRSYLALDEGQELTPDLTPIDHGLNSLATVGLLLELEEQFAVTIPDEKLATVATASVRELWAFLESEGATG